MTADMRLAALGTALLLVSSAILVQTSIDGRLPVVLAALASVGAVAAVFRASSQAS
ncbi:hypothetical protein [Haloferax sp. DFSO60]|uniref:hypothetical protein n=1 Tax=Haloferax sp. DFSO60 TaxID=3388652 RepID=UPI003979F4E2